MIIVSGIIEDKPNWKVASDDEIVNNFFDHFMSKIRAIDHRFGRSGMKFEVSITDYKQDMSDLGDSLYLFRFRITEKYLVNIIYSIHNKEWTLCISEVGDISLTGHYICSFPRMEAVIQKIVEYIIWY